MACLIQDSIPQSLLLPGESRNKEINAIGTLTAYSLIIKREARESFDMHRLVYLATRNWLRNQCQLSIWTDRALMRLADVVPYGGHEGQTTWTEYLPHAIYVAASLDISDEMREVKVTMFDKIGMCQYSAGQYKAAERTHRHALKLKEMVFGKEHRSALMSMNDVGLVLSKQGKYAEAEEMHQQTLKLMEKMLGKKHPDTLTSMNNFGLMLSNQGKYAEAEKMYQQT